LWKSFGGSLVSGPVVVFSAVNWLDVFGLRPKNNYVGEDSINTRIDWQSLGHILDSPPAFLTLRSDTTVVFGLTTNNHIYQRVLISVAARITLVDL
jgi:hypothetical protein